MPKLFQAELQIIGDDRDTADKIQQMLESKLGQVDVFVREVNYAGNIEAGLAEQEDLEEDYGAGDDYPVIM